MKKFFISLLIFLLSGIVEVSYLAFWIAAFFVALTWPNALDAVKTGDPALGFSAVFTCVAAIFVPLFMGTVFWLVIVMLRRKLATLSGSGLPSSDRDAAVPPVPDQKRRPPVVEA